MTNRDSISDSATASAIQQPTQTPSFCRNVLIVGGGSAGLAAALMLAKRGWTEITVLEKRVAADDYEPDKSYNYLIDGRAITPCPTRESGILCLVSPCGGAYLSPDLICVFIRSLSRLVVPLDGATRAR
jgi:hypothetical protein